MCAKCNPEAGKGFASFFCDEEILKQSSWQHLLGSVTTRTWFFEVRNDNFLMNHKPLHMSRRVGWGGSLLIQKSDTKVAKNKIEPPFKVKACGFGLFIVGLNMKKNYCIPWTFGIKIPNMVFWAQGVFFQRGPICIYIYYLYLRIFKFNCVRFIWPFDVPPRERAFLFFQRAESRRSVVCSHEQWQQNPRAVTFKHTMLVNRHAYNGLSQSRYNWAGIQLYDPR